MRSLFGMWECDRCLGCERAIAVWGVRGRSLFGVVRAIAKRCCKKFAFWDVGAIAKRCCKQFAFWGCGGDRCLGCGRAIAFGVWEGDRCFGMWGGRSLFGDKSQKRL